MPDAMPSSPLWASQAKTISTPPDLGDGAKTDATNNGGVADGYGVITSLRSGTEAYARSPATSPAGRAERFVRPARIVLGQEQSAELREQLLTDLSQLQSADQAAD
jgi:hypothetical protein